VFMSVALIAWATFTLYFSEDRKVKRRLSQMSDYEQDQAMAAEPALRPFSERIMNPAGAAVGRAVKTVTPRDYRERLRHRLVLAGSPRGMSAERFTVVKFLAASGILLLGIGVTVVKGTSVGSWLFVLGLAVFAFIAPDLWLSSAISSRQKTIRRALPDMLDMLTISVEAGLGFDQAVSKLVRNSEGPLAKEFARMLQEVQAGVDRSDALRGLVWRTEVPELSAFITAIIQAEVFGISISSVLRTQAAEMRLKRRQMAEEAAQKAPVKMVFPLILCILPATMIVVLGPAIVSVGRAFGMISR